MTAERPRRKERAGVDRAGRTALRYAAGEGDVALVRESLVTGLNANAADDKGWTPLHFAAQKSAIEVVRLLLNAGAAVDPRDSNGNTPLWRAVFQSRGNGEVIELLRKSGADPRIENERGISPLKLARTIDNYDVQQLFNDLPG